MKNIYLIIEIHQPMRFRTYRFFEIKNSHYYYDDYENEFVIMKTSEKAYMPVNKTLLNLVKKHSDKFRFTFLFSGVVLDQFELYAPDMVANYQAVINTGNADLLNGTYSNSLGYPDWSLNTDQLALQGERVSSLFGRSTISIPDRRFLNNGAKRNGIRVYSSNQIFNQLLTDCFSGRRLCNWTRTCDTLTDALNDSNNSAGPVIIFIPYNMAGDYINKNMEIPEFLEKFTPAVLSKTGYRFANASSVPDFTTGRLPDNPLSPDDHNYEIPFPSLFNPMQLDAMGKLYSCRELAGSSSDRVLRQDWLYLQSGDHFYDMDQALYDEQTPYGFTLRYDSAYFAYINYMNILLDFCSRIGKPTGNFQVRTDDVRSRTA